MTIKKKVKKARRPKTNLDTVRRVFSGIDTDNKFWKPKVGDNVIRILPSNREDGNFAYHSIMHHGFKVDGNNRAFPCLGVFSKKCPVCQVISYYDTETDPDIKAVMQEIMPRHAYLMNIIDRKGGSESVLIYSAPKTIMKEVMQYMNDEEYGDITDPDEGRDVKINRVGERMATRYSTRVSPKTSEIGIDNWETGMFNLEKEAYREIPNYKRYMSILQNNFGETLDINSALGIEEEEDEEEEESPRKRKPKLKVVKKKARRVEEDEEDIDDDDDEEEDDDDLNEEDF